MSLSYLVSYRKYILQIIIALFSIFHYIFLSLFNSPSGVVGYHTKSSITGFLAHDNNQTTKWKLLKCCGDDQTHQRINASSKKRGMEPVL